MKVVKRDWHSKFSEEIIEALLHIKVEGLEIEDFIKEHSSYVEVFWWDGKGEKKEGNVNQKTCKKRSRKIKRLRFPKLCACFNLKIIMLC